MSPRRPGIVAPPGRAALYGGVGPRAGAGVRAHGGVLTYARGHTCRVDAFKFIGSRARAQLACGSLLLPRRAGIRAGSPEAMSMVQEDSEVCWILTHVTRTCKGGQCRSAASRYKAGGAGRIEKDAKSGGSQVAVPGCDAAAAAGMLQLTAVRVDMTPAWRARPAGVDLPGFAPGGDRGPNVRLPPLPSSYARVRSSCSPRCELAASESDRANGAAAGPDPTRVRLLCALRA